MIYSIIIPSYNQDRYIRRTLENIIEIKRIATGKKTVVEVLVFDSESNEEVQKILAEYASRIDVIEIKKDRGQFDAINKGIERCRGDYWTWINTDDYIDIDGFLKVVEILEENPAIDYIYGDVKYMDGNDNLITTHKCRPLTLDYLVNNTPGIFQPGSFFKSSFTKKIGLIKEYNCCFDYEYVVRCLKYNARLYHCNFPLASFRYYNDSKSGSMIPVFIREQLLISADYGRKSFSFLTFFSYLRLFKHKLFPRN